MYHMTDAQETALHDLITQFVAINMGDVNTTPLHQEDADYIGDLFYGMLMDNFVNIVPDINDADETL